MRWDKLGWVVGVLLVGCGAGTPEAQTAPTAMEEAMEEERSEATTDMPPALEEEQTESEKEAEAAPPPQPEFRPGMSVEEAILAVPQSAQRVNIEQDALAAPLMRMELYEPCKLSGSQKFKLRVAVWDGRAVGIDVSSQPKNEQLDVCLRQQIEGVTWADKVKSLNTVEFSY